MSIVSTILGVVHLPLLDGSSPPADGGGGGGPPPWVLLVLGGLTILYLTVIRPMRKGKKKPDPMEQPAARLSLAQQRAVEREMGNLLVEYEEMVRRMTAHLETRAAKLELLIREADEKIARLGAAVEGADARADAGAPVGDDAGPAMTSADAPDPGSPPPTEAPPASLPPAGRSAGPDARHTEVYRLADNGQSPRQIARKLNRPHGEIELILALRTTKR